MNWKYNGKEIKSAKDIPDGAIGFVYLIQTAEGKYYIGKKNLKSNRNQEIAESTWRKLKKEGKEGLHRTKNKKLSKKGEPVWRYKINKIADSDWKTYTSSNDQLKKDIKNGVNYYKTISHFAFSKKQLSYLEEKMLYTNEVLENGEVWYNDNIAGRYFTKDIIKR